MPITTPLDEFRLLIGDTDQARALFNDDEAQWFIDQATDVTAAAADACDQLATRFARDFDFAEDGQSFRRGQMSAAYAARAKILRQRSSQSGSAQLASRVFDDMTEQQLETWIEGGESC